jgi:hypothetical protein
MAKRRKPMPEWASSPRTLRVQALRSATFPSGVKPHSGLGKHPEMEGQWVPDPKGKWWDVGEMADVREDHLPRNDDGTINERIVRIFSESEAAERPAGSEIIRDLALAAKFSDSDVSGYFADEDDVDNALVAYFSTAKASTDTDKIEALERLGKPKTNK